MFQIFQAENSWNFPSWKFLEFSKLAIIRILLIGNFYNFPNRKFFGLLQIENFSHFPNRKLFEFFKLDIIEIF